MRIHVLIILLVSILIVSPAYADSFNYKGRQRAYVVSASRSSKKLGVFVVLHGNGGSGNTAIGRWTRIVQPDGVICVGPNSINQASAWRDQEQDGIDFIKELVKNVAKKYKVDGKRIYIGGYSAGACQACRIGIPNSDYFAGIMTYAGSSGPALGPRKIPVALVHGDQDRAVGVDGTRKLHKMLKDAGWPVWYKEIPGQGHSYNGKFDKEAWHWVKTHPPKDPPELIVIQKLVEAEDAMKNKKYRDAYKAYKDALETGLEKEKAQEGIKKIEELGRAKILEALETEKKSTAKAKRILKKIHSDFKDTPVAEKAVEEINRLSDKKPGDTQTTGKKDKEQPVKKTPEKDKETAEDLMRKAENYIQQDMIEAARSVLERILDEFTESPLAEKARKKLAELED